MNQKSRQAASSKVEKDFYKLLNNRNFGIDCRNNINNCYLEPIYDDIDEVGFISKYTNILSDENYREFFSPDLFREKINSKFDSKLFALNKNDPTYEARLKYLERQRDGNLDAVSSFEKNQKAKKRKFQTVEEKIAECADPRKTKMVTDFNDYEAVSIKSIAVKKKSVIRATTRFILGKLLMFAKLSIKSFIYSWIEKMILVMLHWQLILKNTLSF